jgi:diacylglycerol O-acyltransferase / wax synthase
VAIRQISPLDAAWLTIESRDTPMHVGGLFEFSLPEGAGPQWLRDEFERMRGTKKIPQPWNLKLVDGPVIGHRLPLMREDLDLDLDYHVRHSALPYPGGQRDLGILVSRLHSHQLDLHRPLWECHLIEGLDEGARFAIYIKMHHSLIDGVSGMRMLLRTLSGDPEERNMRSFWTVGAGSRRPRPSAGDDAGAGSPLDPSRLVDLASQGIGAAAGLARAGLQLASAAVDDSGLQAPYTAPPSALGGRLGGQRRFATQQYELDQLRAFASAADCTLNDIVLYLCSTSLRHYLDEHARIPERSLKAGVPVNLRDPEDQSAGTAIGMIIAELATNVADPRERIDAIKRSMRDAKQHLQELPKASRTPYTLALNAPFITALVAGLGGRAPAPFNVTISNVPGPTEPLYFNGARLDALFPLSLLTHGMALNITCVSYAGTMNFGFTGARDTLPHLQRLALYMAEAVAELDRLLLDGKGEVAATPTRSTAGPSASGKRSSADRPGEARAKRGSSASRRASAKTSKGSKAKASKAKASKPKGSNPKGAKSAAG